MGRPPKPADDKLVTLSVRIPKTSLDLLERVVEGEISYLQKRRLPTRGVHKSAAFRTIWELGEQEYLLQRATLWLTRRFNRYTLEQAARVLGWDVTSLWRMLRERGVEVAAPVPKPPEPGADVKADDPAAPAPRLDPGFLH